eukprot:m.102897 g.102897  ORF g.102897 m.102897 type:complete len:1072 (-) comp10455_c0_seq1:229-3444(-)
MVHFVNPIHWAVMILTLCSHSVVSQYNDDFYNEFTDAPTNAGGVPTFPPFAGPPTSPTFSTESPTNPPIPMGIPTFPPTSFMGPPTFFVVPTSPPPSGVFPPTFPPVGSTPEPPNGAPTTPGSKQPTFPPFSGPPSISVSPTTSFPTFDDYNYNDYGFPPTTALPTPPPTDPITFAPFTDAPSMPPSTATTRTTDTTQTTTTTRTTTTPRRACPVGEYQEGSRGCEPWTTCPAGTRVSFWGTPTMDRQCEPCGAGEYTNQPNQLNCVLYNDCPPGTIVVSGPTTTTGRVCAACSTTINFNDQVNGRDCVNVRTCPPGTFMSRLPTRSADRQCTNCLGDTYSYLNNTYVCLARRICRPGQEYGLAQPTPTTDRQCATATISCAYDEIEVSPVTATTDRACEENLCLRAGQYAYCDESVPQCSYTLRNSALTFQCSEASTTTGVSTTDTVARRETVSSSSDEDTVEDMIILIFLIIVGIVGLVLVVKYMRGDSKSDSVAMTKNPSYVIPYFQGGVPGTPGGNQPPPMGAYTPGNTHQQQQSHYIDDSRYARAEVHDDVRASDYSSADGTGEDVPLTLMDEWTMANEALRTQYAWYHGVTRGKESDFVKLSNAEGLFRDGKFFVAQVTPDSNDFPAYVLNINYQSRPTRHLVKDFAGDGILTINTKRYGDFEDIESLVQALGRKDLPDGWPIRLVRTIDSETGATVGPNAVPTFATQQAVAEDSQPDDNDQTAQDDAQEDHQGHEEPEEDHEGHEGSEEDGAGDEDPEEDAVANSEVSPAQSAEEGDEGGNAQDEREDENNPEPTERRAPQMAAVMPIPPAAAPNRDVHAWFHGTSRGDDGDKGVIAEGKGKYREGKFIVTNADKRDPRYPAWFLVFGKSKTTAMRMVIRDTAGDGKLTVDGKSYGDHSSVESLIAALSASKKPKGWPTRLTKTMDRLTKKTIAVNAKPIIQDPLPKIDKPWCQGLTGGRAKDFARLQSSTGAFEDGLFFVAEVDADSMEHPAWCLNCNFKGKPSRHLIKYDEKGFVCVGGQKQGDHKSLEQVIDALSAEKLPKGWPARLTHTIDPQTGDIVAV